MESRGFEEPEWLWIVILVFLILINVIGPFIIYLILKCNEQKEEFGNEEETEGMTMERYGVTNTIDPLPGANLKNTNQAKRSRIRNISLARILSIISFINFWCYIPWSASCLATTCWHFSRTLLTMAIAGAVVIPLGYVFMLLESLCSREQDYISKLGEARTVATVISTIREAKPYITWYAECFHYETHTRNVNYTDSHGNRRTRKETSQVRVVTYRDQQIFIYNYWTDVSAPKLEGVSKYGVTRIRLEKKILPGDEETSAEYVSGYEAFKARNSYRDTHIFASAEQTIHGFEKRIAAFVDEHTAPWWMNMGFYWLTVFLAVTWPYRWYFRAKTAKTHYTICKKFYMTRPQEEGIRQFDDPLAVAGGQLEGVALTIDTEKHGQRDPAASRGGSAETPGGDEASDVAIDLGGTIVRPGNHY